jgi:hypothetical protein
VEKQDKQMTPERKVQNETLARTKAIMDTQTSPKQPCSESCKCNEK